MAAPTVLFRTTSVEYRETPASGPIPPVPLYEYAKVKFEVEAFSDDGSPVNVFVKWDNGSSEVIGPINSYEVVTFYHIWRRLGIYNVEYWAKSQTGTELGKTRTVEVVITKRPSIPPRPAVGISSLNGLSNGFDEGYGRALMSEMADQGCTLMREHFIFNDIVKNNLAWHLEQMDKMLRFGTENHITVILSPFFWNKGYATHGFKDYQHCGDTGDDMKNYIEAVARLLKDHAIDHQEHIFDTGNEPHKSCTNSSYHRWIRDTAGAAGANRHCTQLPAFYTNDEFEFINVHVHIDSPTGLRRKANPERWRWRLLAESDTERYGMVTPSLAQAWLDHIVLTEGCSGIILSPGDLVVNTKVKDIVKTVGQFSREHGLT